MAKSYPVLKEKESQKEGQSPVLSREDQGWPGMGAGIRSPGSTAEEETTKRRMAQSQNL